MTLEESGGTTLENTEILSFIDLNQKSALIEHALQADTLIEASFSVENLAPPITSDHEVNNPCKLLTQVNFSEDELVLMKKSKGTVKYTPDSVSLLSGQQCPDSSSIPTDIDLSWISYEL